MTTFRYLKHKDIDPAKWDRCIQDSRLGLIYAMYWYLDLVSPGWEALVLEDAGSYKAVLPVTWQQKYGIRYVQRPFVAPQLGLFTSDKANKAAYLAECLQLLTHKFRFIDYPLNEEVSFINGLAENRFQIDKGVTYLLDLQRSYEEIQKGYHQNLKRNIRKAQQAGLFVKHEPGAMEELVNLYRRHKGKELQNVGSKQYQMLMQIYTQAQQQGIAYLLTARSQTGLLEAGAVFLRCGHRIIYIFGGSSEAGRHHRAMPLVMDGCIKHLAGEVQLLDFEGSNIPNLARFYGSFGAAPVSYAVVQYNHLPFLLRLVKNIRHRLY